MRRRLIACHDIYKFDFFYMVAYYRPFEHVSSIHSGAAPRVGGWGANKWYCSYVIYAAW